MEKDNITLWLEQLFVSTSTCIPHTAEDGYPAGASAIVEPWLGMNRDEELPEVEAYYEFQERQPKAWSAFIRANFGNDWGDIAEKVNIEGY